MKSITNTLLLRRDKLRWHYRNVDVKLLYMCREKPSYRWLSLVSLRDTWSGAIDVCTVSPYQQLQVPLRQQDSSGRYICKFDSRLSQQPKLISFYIPQDQSQD